MLCRGMLCSGKGSESPRSTCQVISSAGNSLQFYNGACSFLYQPVSLALKS